VRSGNREESNVPRPFNGLGNLTLMLGAVAGYPAWNDLAPLADEVAQSSGILIIYGYLFIGAETAYLPALKRSFFPWTGTSLWCSLVTHLS
jgi:hypothetical protein